ncbi:MAG: hypothetical protein ACO1TE_06640 [Prosthecobacter sp.]
MRTEACRGGLSKNIVVMLNTSCRIPAALATFLGMLFKKKPKTSSPTLKKRVEEFWKWYSTNAERFHAIIQAKRCSDLTSETSEAVGKYLPGMAWVFGPGEREGEESFTLSGEAILPEQFVAEYWLSRAPKLKDWIFYSSRQRSKEPRGFSIRLENKKVFRPEEFWLTPHVNMDTEEIDVKVWHPCLLEIDKKMRFTALFLMLDEILGEHGTQHWIGKIEFSEEHLKQSMPIAELHELVQETQKEHGWKKYPPTETYSSYELNRQESPWLRSDTIAGTSRCFSLLRSFFDAKGPCEHPLPKLGIQYIYVSIRTDHFPKGEQVKGRVEIEDATVEALEAEGAGICLGGATGTENCYIDFALYDGDRSLETVKSVLRRHEVPRGTKIRFFTSDRAKEVISV